MENFHICFISDAAGDAPPDGCRYGEIRIGPFRERFLSSLAFWDEAKYERQWVAAASHIMTADRAVMITSLTDPATSNFVRWWAMYRDGETIVFQEQICFLDELSEPFDAEAPEKSMRHRQTMSEEGQPISEWSAPVSAVRVFARKGAEVEGDT